MELAFLGGAGGIGASCLLVELAGLSIGSGTSRCVLIDAGVRMDPSGDRLPDLAALDGRDLAAIFVTHAHADHIGALPLVHQHFPAFADLCLVGDDPPYGGDAGRCAAGNGAPRGGGAGDPAV